MKIFIFILIIIFSVKCSTQEVVIYENLPENVKHYFPVVYKLDDTVNVIWTIEDSLYVGRFISNSYPVEIHFKPNGFWVNTFWTINWDFVPDFIKKYKQEHYPDYEVELCTISNNAFNEQYYNITLRSSEVSDKDLTSVNIRFTLDGKLAKQ